MHPATLLNGLRFVDSFFPSGGYAFSFGLEAAVQSGIVTTAAELDRYIQDQFQRGMGRREAVAVGLAHDAITRKDCTIAQRADAELDAMQLSRESRLASRQMGRQIIRVAAEQLYHPTLREYARDVENAHEPGHVSVAIGMTLGAAGWDKESAIAAFLYQTAQGSIAAALKLLPIGQHEGQALLAAWTPRIGELSKQAASETTLRGWTPLQDIQAMRHGRLASRLFRS